MNSIERGTNLLKATSALKRGGVIIYPTETCYGLGCNALNKQAVKRIFRLKKRKPGKPLLVLVSSIAMWKRIAKVSKKALELAKKKWPGPYSIVLPKKPIILDILTKEKVGARISSNRTANSLVKKCGFPIISTSANIAGGPNSYSVKEIPDSVKKGVDYIFDVGPLPKNPPSRVVKLAGNKIRIIRK